MVRYLSFALAFALVSDAAAANLDTRFGTEPQDPLQITGSLSMGSQFYRDSPVFPSQVDGPIPTLEGSIRIDYAVNDWTDRFVLEGRGRLDFRADTDLIDAKEAYYSHDGDGWRFLGGVHTLFWGVTETRHLVNVINQVDLAGDVVEEQYLGQPMVNLGFDSEDFGSLDFYGLFGFRPRDHPDTADRLRLSEPVLDSLAIYEGSEAEKHIGYAVRHANSLNAGAIGLDYGVYYFHGTSREPRFDLDMTFSEGAPVPAYDIMDQVGIDTVLTLDSLQLKFEGIWRKTSMDEFTAAVAGFEYTLPEVAGASIGVIGEYLYDGRSENPFVSPPTAFQNDISGGLRVNLNDQRNTSFLGGMTYDLDDSSKSVSVEFRTLVMEDLLFSLDGRAFIDPTPILGETFPVEDSFVRTKLTKFF